MSNIHGFDFLRTEHVLPSAGGGGRATPDGEGAFDNYDAPPSPSKYVSSTAPGSRWDVSAIMLPVDDEESEHDDNEEEGDGGHKE